MRRILFVLAIFLAVVAIATGQTSNQLAAKPANDASIGTTAPTAVITIPEPEYSGSVYLLADNKLAPLERQTPTVFAKGRFSLTEKGIMFSGVASPSRVDPTATFVVKVESQEDPSLLFLAVRMEQDAKNGIRKVTIGKTDVFGGTKPGPMQKVGLSFTRNGTFFVFTPATPLQPGEYGVVNNKGGPTTWLFGVDAK
jgi:hypothetical protein